MKVALLQQLLKMTFTSEKLYYQAADQVQVIKFSRFLNHQSTLRNKLCNRLIEKLTSNNIEPEKRHIDKLTVDVSGLEIKRRLENKDYVKQVKKCLNFDNEIIDKCKELLEVEDLPIDILEILSMEMGELLVNIIRGEKIIESYQKEQRIESHRQKTKIIRLSSN